MKNKDFILCFLISGLCACESVEAPKDILPVPEPKQVEWQKMETYAFIHFGLNTFNDREWGYGNSDPMTFNPSKLDCEQWVKTFVNSGMKGVILTTKHHDGFCLWPFMGTEYNISKSPYKNGKGNIVKELSEQCKKYGLKFGVYLSPWDRNHPEYGTEAYLKYYYAQLEDLLKNYGDLFEVWFDGANGGDGWYGGNEGIRNIDRKTYYNFPKIHEMIYKYHPNAIIFADGGPGCRWVGNEKGFAGETNWSFLIEGKVHSGYPHHHELTVGHADGNQWVPAECDVSIRPGWFYHKEEDDLVKTPEQLVDLYYKSVGRNGNLLLNFPIDRRGLIHPIDSANAVEFHKIIQRDFSNNIVKDVVPFVTNKRGGVFNESSLTDENYDTYWATEDGVNNAEIIFDFTTPVVFNRIMLQEYILKGQRVKAFEIDILKEGKWEKVDCGEETTTIGYKRLLRFESVKSNGLRIRILDSRGPICMNNIGVYHAETLNNSDIDNDFIGLDFKVLNVSLENQQFVSDKSVNTSGALGWNQIVLDLGRVMEISSFNYLPDQSFQKRGLISNYELWCGDSLDNLNKKLSYGEFSNIQNNPIMQTIRFKPIKTRYLKLKAIRMINPNDEIFASEIVVK